MRILKFTFISLSIGFGTLQATPLTPVPNQDVTSMVSGLTDEALASGGATATADTYINSNFAPGDAIDGLLGTNGYPWIATDVTQSSGPPPDWLVVDFHGTAPSLGTLVLSGRYPDRSGGLYTFQYSTAPSPLTHGSTWTTIGTYAWSSTAPMPRTAFGFPVIANVTGIQLLSQPTNSNGVWGNSIQEFEAYPAFTTIPAILTQPQGTNIYVTQTATFSVAVTAGTAFQWLKNLTNIVGATSSVYQITNAQLTDAGSYTVAISNAIGSVTSAAAIMNVSSPPMPVLTIEGDLLISWTNTPGYVLQGSPSLDIPQWTTISNWTVNVGGIIEMAIPPSTNQFFRMYYE
jgi:hypothetical protein